MSDIQNSPTNMYGGVDYQKRASGLRQQMNDIAGQQFQGPGQFSMQGWRKDDPGYKFRLNQGINAVNNSYAGKGMAQSGAAMKALNDYAQGQASSEYQNSYNRRYQQYSDNYNRSYDQWKNRQSAMYQNAANRYGDLENNAAQGYNTAMGQRQYGNQMAMQNYSNQVANRDYMNNADLAAYNRTNAQKDAIFNRYANMSGTGQQTYTTMGQLGMQNNALINDYLTSGASAQGAGLIGSANAHNQSMQNAQNFTVGMTGALMKGF
jgi:hypothetical protein